MSYCVITGYAILFIIYYTVLYDIKLGNTMLCYVMLCKVALCCDMVYGMMFYCITLSFVIISGHQFSD